MAWLACAWVRQKIVAKKNGPVLGDPPEKGALPWEEKPYWQKERVQLGLMQLASANRQAPMWSGEADVLSLSDGQILLFLFLLQHVWDVWLRDRRGDPDDKFAFPIKQEIQGQGMREASNEWRSKQTEGPNAFLRRSFVDTLGEDLYVSLTNDKAMSNPGANGFSIENSDLDNSLDVKTFLMDAVSFGDLVEGEHTSKKKGEKRTKFYLTPILSPYFRIPSVHTKEPRYVTSKDIKSWIRGQRSKPTSELESTTTVALNVMKPSTTQIKQPGFWDEDDE